MTDGADGRIGGYRVVRKLGAGSRADVYVGSGETGVVALKVFHADVALDDVGRELDALGRLDSPHFARLLDVASGDTDAPVLILERVQRGSVASLLQGRDWLERGEIVTLLAPVAGSLPVMHRLGVAHGRLGASSVHIGSSGEPVLLGFGHAELFARGGSIAAIDAEPAAASDREALASLGVALLSRVRDAAMDRPTIELIQWIDAEPREFEFTDRLVGRLFDYAEPIPVEFAPPRASAGNALPGRLGVGTALTGPEWAPREPTHSRSSTPTVAPAQLRTPESDGIVGWLSSALASNPLDVVKQRATAFVRGVRKPIWFIAAGVVAALVLAITLLPQNAAAPARAVATGTATPIPAMPSPTATALPDDPVQALPILLAERSRCVRALSVLCLDDVDEASSSAFNDDAALVEELQGGSEIPKSAYISAAAPALTELIGDSAILNLGGEQATGESNPASVLVIKTEAGWRIRGYLSGVPSTGTPSQPG